MTSALDFTWTGSKLFFSATGAIELFFIVIALVIAALAIKAYKFTDKKNYAYLSRSFLLISIAYMIRLTDNIVFFSSNIIPDIALAIQSSDTIQNFLLVLYILFTITSYMTLVISFMGLKSKRALIFMYVMSFIITYASFKTIGIFYITNALFLFFVISFLYTNFTKTKNNKSFMLFVAFMIIFLVSVFSLILKTGLFSVFNNLTFGILQIAMLVSYSIIILVLISIFRKTT